MTTAVGGDSLGITLQKQVIPALGPGPSRLLIILMVGAEGSEHLADQSLVEHHSLHYAL